MPDPYAAALEAIRTDRAEVLADLDLVLLALQSAQGRPDERELLEAAATLEHAALGDCEVLGTLIEQRFPGAPEPDADPSADEARAVLRRLRDPVLESLDRAPIDDEPETPEERRAVARARAELRAGARPIPLERFAGARGPWFITARAVREYLTLTGREPTEQAFPDGEDELLEIARDESRRHFVRRQDNGQDLYRLRGTPRLRLLVAPGPRPEGPLPQLVRVLAEHASSRKR